MAEKNIVPEIRFSGFTGEWERHKLSDVACRVTTMSGEAGFPRVEYEDINSGQGTLNKNLYEKNSTKKGVIFQKYDVLFGKLRPYLKNWLLADFPGIAVGDFWVLRSDEMDSSYIFSLIQSSAFDEVANQSTGTKMPRADWNLVSNTMFAVPCSRQEQQDIGSFLLCLDNLITLHQRKLLKLKNVKKSMLEKMFPKDGASVPEIRFAGFKDTWERRDFGEVVIPYTDPVVTPNDGYVRLGIRSHSKGTFHSYVRPGMQLETAKMHRVGANNFIVNITFGWEHAVAITDVNDAGKLVSHRFPQFSFVDDMDPRFFKFVILDEKFRHHLWLSSPGGAGRNRVLKISEMLEYKFWVTTKDEQKRIADFFQELDNHITLQNQKLNKLKNIKQAMLEKMFV